MRRIDIVVMHCTATLPTAKLAAIERFWREVRGWQQPGYHYLVAADGTVHPLQPEWLPANGVRGLNHRCLHVSYIGGVDAAGRATDTRTAAQKMALEELVRELLARYSQAQVAGHYHFAAKACPSFDVPGWLTEMGVPQARIFRNGKESPVQ